MKSIELRDKRTKLVSDAKALLELSTNEHRDLSDDESTKYESMIVEAEKLGRDIERAEKLEAVEVTLSQTSQRVSQPISETPHDSRTPGQRQVDAYRSFLKSGEVRDELRTLVIGTDSKGGNLVAPVDVTNDLLKKLDEEVFIRKFATKHRLKNAKKVGVPKLDERGEAVWGNAESSTSQDTSMEFGRLEIEPLMLKRLTKTSVYSLENSDNIEQIINDDFVRAFSAGEEHGYILGSGNQEPYGLMYAHPDGLPTSRDFSVSAAAGGALDADKLIDVKHKLRPGYRNRSTTGWLFHSDVVASVRKLKNDEGDYLWTDGNHANGNPPTLLGIPVYESELMPSSLASGSYVGILGDFHEYHICEVTDLQVKRLDELYAEDNEVGFLGRRFVNGAPGIAEAFCRLKMTN